MTPFGDLMLAAQSALQTRVAAKESFAALMDHEEEEAVL